MLKRLTAIGTGPQPSYDLELAPRLNIFTGDNGLGKTFILDLVFYACTFTWARETARPNLSSDSIPKIAGYFSPNLDGSENILRANFDQRLGIWQREKPPTKFNSAVVIYAGVKSDYTIWDSLRTPYMDGDGDFAPWWQSGKRSESIPDAFRFSESELHKGKYIQGDRVCNGMIADFVDWGFSHKSSSAKGSKLINTVLASLSPPNERISFGELEFPPLA